MNKVKDDNRLLLRKLLHLAIPMMIANAFSNLISLVNNITVGSLGTEQLSGVAIANQIINVYNLCIYGGMGQTETRYLPLRCGKAGAFPFRMHCGGGFTERGDICSHRRLLHGHGARSYAARQRYYGQYLRSMRGSDRNNRTAAAE